MKFKVIGTGSSGNCYSLTDKENQILLLDAGLSWKVIKRAIGGKVGNIQAALITHEHQDHCKAAGEMYHSGVDVISSELTLKKLDLLPFDFMRKGDLIQAGNYQFMFFSVQHDAIDPVGFIVYHNEIGSLTYITDTGKIPKLNGINHVVIEANYSHEKLIERVIEDKIPMFLANRIQQDHASIEMVCDCLENSDLSETKSITLIHLSDGNSLANEFVDVISRRVGIKPKIATKGLEFEL